MSNVIPWPHKIPTPELSCSFCKRPSSACKKLIAGNKAAICDECADKARHLLHDSKEAVCSPAE